MNEDQPTAGQARYLIKVLLGIALLGFEVLVALGLPEAVISVALVVTMLMQVPLIRWLYGRADELRQLMHRQACTRTLAWLAAGSGVAGVLQANGLIPVFNQFWMLGALVAMWGVQLMLADRPHH
jgi:hypothetical protein